MMTNKNAATLAAVVAIVAGAAGAYYMFHHIKARYKRLPWWKRALIRLVA